MLLVQDGLFGLLLALLSAVGSGSDLTAASAAAAALQLGAVALVAAAGLRLCRRMLRGGRPCGRLWDLWTSMKWLQRRLPRPRKLGDEAVLLGSLCAMAVRGRRLLTVHLPGSRAVGMRA